MLSKQLEYPIVKLATAAVSGAAARSTTVMAQPQEEKQKTGAAPAAAAMQSILRMAVENGHYTDSVRERDRYMIQWFDYKCGNCGTVWNKDSVTISYRQTAVSECQKGKRSCTSRAECARMLSGEKFITIKHMAGNVTCGASVVYENID